MEAIRIRGARQHNLKNIDLDLPRDRLIVFTGVSGSGKSSLAYDTLYAEGQRRYVECLSTYARQFVGELERPDVDSIEGLPPTVTVKQEITAVNPRSTVATVTEIYDYLRLLFARIGTPHCYLCGAQLGKQSPQQIAARILDLQQGTRVMILSPVVVGRKGHHRDVLARLLRDGFLRARVDGQIVELDPPPELVRTRKHTIEAIVDRFRVRGDLARRVADSVETALRHGQGTIVVAYEQDGRWVDTVFSTKHACLRCGISYGEIAPRLFSFNSPAGACPTCDGLGIRPDVLEEVLEEEQWTDAVRLLSGSSSGARRGRRSTLCTDCRGTRLRPEARSVLIAGRSITDLTALDVAKLAEFFDAVRLEGRDSLIGEPIVAAIRSKLTFLRKVGLDYLTLDRPAITLSGGEFQRLKLAAYLGSGLVGVCYILDEPTIGLHPRDNRRLLDALRELRDAGNTVIVVEHDEATIRSADIVVDLGPGAGRHGGEVVYAGKLDGLLQEPRSVTGRYLSGAERIAVPERRRPPAPDQMLTLLGVRTHNLKNITVSFPLGLFVVVTGVSGSGKSSLVTDTLVPALRRKLGIRTVMPGPHRRLVGADKVDRVIEVEQTPIGRTPRSNPATYVGVWDHIRKLFAQTKEARLRGFTASRFSTNVPGGRCETCKGLGVQRIEMQFLPDVFVTCEACRGRRFNQSTLSVRFQGKSIADVLDMTVEEALEFFRNQPQIARILSTLRDIGLGYITLGQPSTTVSGGEAQRIKLAYELSKRSTGRTVYVLDEPTTGLHFADIRRLLDVLHQLVEQGNTVIVIEHNLDVIKCADWIIDLGPEGGEQGGQVVAVGPPEAIAANPASWTGQALRRVIELHHDEGSLGDVA